MVSEMPSHASPAALSRAALPLMGHPVGVAGQEGQARANVSDLEVTRVLS